jgi:anti-anti-sigma factor
VAVERSDAEGGAPGDGPTDDAAVAARLAPAPLLLDQVTDSAGLRDVRRRVREWAGSAGLDPDTTDDLLLAVGEAAANAVEHAYGGAPGRLRVTATVEGGERVALTVADEGRWRPEPADPGFRGRGLLVLRELGDGSLAVDRGSAGTVVRLAVPLPAGRTGSEDGRTGEGAGPAGVGVDLRDGTRYVTLTGELGLDGVPAVRTALLAALGGPEPVVLDLTGLAALSSSGLGLLLEVTLPRPGHPAPSALLPESGPVRRLLDMTGLAGQLRASRDAL